MINNQKVLLRQKTNFWLFTQKYSLLLFFVYSVSAFFVEKYSGSCMFVIPVFFYALITVYVVLKMKHFLSGTALYILFATLGVAMDYYGDWVYSKNLISPFYSLGWGPVFLGFGFSVDLAYKFTQKIWTPRKRAIFMGLIFGIAYYSLIRFALSTFYPVSDNPGHLIFFTKGIYFTLPWIILNSIFGGYTAYAINRRI